MNPAEVIAEALAAHDGHGDNAFDDFYACSCGWTSDIVVYDERKAAHVAHQASVIAALPDIAIVPLPESHPPSDLFQDWWTDDGGWTVERHVGSPQIRLTFDEDDAMETSPNGEFYPFARLTETEAHDLGVALLAAARVVGGES